MNQAECVAHFNKASPKERGHRIKCLFVMANLSLKQISEESGFPLAVLKNWEDGLYGGISEQNAKKLCEFLANNGVIVSAQWIMEEKGDNPLMTGNFTKL